MAFYGDLKTTADALLARFKQGTVEIGRPSSAPGVEPWDPPIVTTAWNEIDAIVKGVSQGLVDGVQVLASDLEVVANVKGYDPQAADLMRIDGNRVNVIKIMPIPAAGVAVAHRFIVRR